MKYVTRSVKNIFETIYWLKVLVITNLSLIKNNQLIGFERSNVRRFAGSGGAIGVNGLYES